MAFADLQKAIFDEAALKVEKLRGANEDDLRREELRVKDQARVVEEVIITAAKERGVQEAQRLHQTTQLNARADVLNAKQEELVSLQAKAVAEILSWDEDKNKALIKALGKLITQDKGVVIAGETHAELVKDLAKSKGLDFSDKTIPNEGGFVYRGEKSEVNATVSFLVSQLFTRHRADMARVLFS